MRRVVMMIVVAASLLSALLYSQRRTKVFRVSGFVEAEEVRVGSRVGGRVARVYVAEGDTVPADNVLFELEPFDLHERRAEAAAFLAERQADLALRQAGYRAEEIAQAAARLDQLTARLEKLEHGPRSEEIEAAAKVAQEAEERYRLAELNYRRAEELLGKGVMTQDAFDQRSSELKTARAAWETRQAQHRLLKKGTRPEEIAEGRAQVREAEAALNLLKNGYRSEEIDRARAAVQAAQSALDAIDRQLDELIVKGPAGAIVQAIDLHAGDLVGPNVPVVSLLDTAKLWVRAYVPENRLNIHVGDPAWVRADSYPGQRFAGHITFISDEAEFTPRNIQTPEERSKQVFRIKVTLDEGLDSLRPGMAADIFFGPDEAS